MNNREYLEQITIPVPCPQDWRRMRGDDRTRHCDACDKNVHNLAAMTSDEVVAVVHVNDGELCGLVTRRADGTLLTSNRGSKPFGTWNPWQFNIKNLMTLIGWMAAAFGLIRLMESQPIVRAGRIRMRAATPATGAQCPGTDLDDDLEADDDLSDDNGSKPNSDPTGAQP